MTKISHGKTAVAIVVTFLLTSWIVSALVSLNFNYTHKIAEPLESFGYLYEKPWTRIGPYIMGWFFVFIILILYFIFFLCKHIHTRKNHVNYCLFFRIKCVHISLMLLNQIWPDASNLFYVWDVTWKLMLFVFSCALFWNCYSFCLLNLCENFILFLCRYDCWIYT